MTTTVKDTFITKYKPYYLNEFQMNEQMLQVIHTLFEIDDLNILFVGSSGTGKTTLLYSIIREYYGISKQTATIPETNIMFVNNLKEQGINYFRNEMKTFSQSQSSIYGKKKMIVLDDLDTINEQSQQVFRNYIDKYGNNIHFVAVCTNIQKVIENIQSRLHIIQIQPPTSKETRYIMDYIIRQENIQMDELAKEYILILSNYCIRNIINYLEKIYIYSNNTTVITEEMAKQICSTISVQKFDIYMKCMKSGKLHHAIMVLYEIYDYGYSVIDILDYFYNYLKLTPELDEETKYKVIPYLCKYITIFNKVHEDVIELAFFTNGILPLFSLAIN